MDNFKFSNTSKKRLKTCHPDLQKIFNDAIILSTVDFGIAEGHRSIEDQQRYFNEGKSLLDGVNKKSKHNYSPSLAVDVYAWVDGKASWDAEHLTEIARVVKYSAAQSQIGIIWGGDWSTFIDMPHFELLTNS